MLCLYIIKIPKNMQCHLSCLLLLKYKNIEITKLQDILVKLQDPFIKTRFPMRLLLRSVYTFGV
jgi:hypothetical protein